jgi:hypothetical protein
LENKGRGGENMILKSACQQLKDENKEKTEKKEMKSDKMTEQEHCFKKLWATWEIQTIGNIIS